MSTDSATLRARILVALVAYERALRQRQWAEDAIPDDALAEPQEHMFAALNEALDEVERRRIELVGLIAEVTA